MKRFSQNIINLLIVVVLLSMMGSCKKEFLEIAPKGRLIAEKTTDYEMLLNDPGLVSIAIQSLMGDHLAAVNPYFTGANVTDQRYFKWEDNLYLASQSATIFSSLMPNVYKYTKIINEVMESKGNEALRKSVRAEARVCRAWSYFQLVNFYAKPYDPATAATDPGVPMMTVADVTNVSSDRETVQKVYDFMIEDLVAAIPELPAKVTHRMRVSKAAGEALLGKIYVFMGQFDKALPYLNASIQDLDGAAIPVKIYDYNTEFDANGFYFPIDPVYGPSYTPISINEEVLFLKASSNNYANSFNGAVLNSEIAALFKPEDLRLNFYSKHPFAETTQSYPDGMLRPWGKLAVNYGISVPEIWLLLAESRSRNNDLPGAVAAVETLREKRFSSAWAVPSDIAADKKKLTEFILEERIRELAIDGYRWFDMRRLSVDPEYKHTVHFTHKQFDMEGNEVGSYTLRPERLTLRFPLYVTDKNTKLVQNP